MKSTGSSKVLATLQYNGSKLYQLNKARTVIGSGTSVDIRIFDPSVLKCHAEIHFFPQKPNFFKSSSLSKTNFTPILKVFATRSVLQVYLNHHLITNSMVLKDNDVITFGHKRHNFVFRLREEPQPAEPSVLITPSVSNSAPSKFPQRNLITDFDGATDNLSQIKLPLEENINQTPSSVIRLRLKEHTASVKQNFSPSVCRYFRQINAKSSHIVNCIEKLFPDQAVHENDIIEQTDQNQIKKSLDASLPSVNASVNKSPSKHSSLPESSAQIDSLQAISPGNNHLECLPTGDDAIKSPSETQSQITPKKMDVNNCLKTMVKLSNLQSPSAIIKSNLTSIRNLARSSFSAKCTTSPISEVDKLFQQNSSLSRHESVCQAKLAQLKEIGTPQANYDRFQLSQNAYHSSPLADCDGTPVANVRQAFQANSPLCQYQSAYLSNIRKLYQNPTRQVQYENCLEQVRNLYHSSPFSDYNQSPVANVRKLFQANSPQFTGNSAYTSKIRKLFQNATPPANYDSSILRQVRFLYQKPPNCDYSSNSTIPYISQMIKREQVINSVDYGQVEGLRDLFEHRSPVADYLLHVNYISNMVRLNQTPRANYDQNVQYVRYLFRNVSSPRAQWQARSIASVRHLFHPPSPKADYDQHVDGMDIFQEGDSCQKESTFSVPTPTKANNVKPSCYSSLPICRSYSHGSSASLQITAITSPTKSTSLTLAFSSPSISPMKSLCKSLNLTRRMRLRQPKPKKEVEQVVKRMSTRKRQPKKSFSGEEELITKLAKVKKTKKISKKVKTKEKVGLKGKRAKGKRTLLSGKPTSLSTLLDKLEQLSEKVDSASPIGLFGKMKWNKSQRMTRQQLANLKMVLSDSFDNLSI